MEVRGGCEPHSIKRNRTQVLWTVAVVLQCRPCTCNITLELHVSDSESLPHWKYVWWVFWRILVQAKTSHLLLKGCISYTCLGTIHFWTQQCFVMRSLAWPLLRWCPENNSPSFPWSWWQSNNLQTLLKDGARVWAIKSSISKNNCSKEKRNNILCGYGYCLVNTFFSWSSIGGIWSYLG